MEFQIRKAREKAGFSQKELDHLQSHCILYKKNWPKLLVLSQLHLMDTKAVSTIQNQTCLLKLLMLVELQSIIYWMWITQRLRQYLPRR